MITTQHTECQFCLGENVPDNVTKYELKPLTYRYIATNEVYDGDACQWCIDFVRYHDADTTEVIS